MNKTNLILKMIMIIILITIVIMFVTNKDSNDVNYLWFSIELVFSLIFTLYLFTKFAKNENILNIISTIFLICMMYIIPIYSHVSHNVRTGKPNIINNQKHNKVASYIETKTVIKNIYGIKINERIR